MKNPILLALVEKALEEGHSISFVSMEMPSLAIPKEILEDTTGSSYAIAMQQREYFMRKYYGYSPAKEET